VVKIPLSRFAREQNQWMRYINNNPDDVIYITRNKLDYVVVMSPKLYDSLVDDVNHIISTVSKDI